MPNSKIKQIQLHGDVYDLLVDSVANQNNASGALVEKFDWVGTQAEYVAQDVATNHPDWFCFITDDISADSGQLNLDNYVKKTGDETITGTKTFSSKVTSSVVTNTYLAGNQGTAIINSTSGAGTYTMLAKMNSTNGYMTIGTYQKNFELHYTAKSTVDAGTNTYTYQAILLDEDGNSSFPGTITGTCTRALWADLAECYQSDEKYPIGTLIQFGGEKDITIAKDNCNGVISDKPGYVLDHELKDSQPVALVGKTPIKIIGKVNKHDKITLSEIPGVGRVAKGGEKVIARALESSDTEEEKLVKCVTKFNLD